MNCPQCRSLEELEPLEERFAAELGGLCNYLFCPRCRTISREVKVIERWLGTALLLPMLGISVGGFGVGCYLWIVLHAHGKIPTGFLLTTFALQAGAAFAVWVILRKLAILHTMAKAGARLIPIGELRE